MADVVADLQQQGDGELAHRGGAVGGHIGHRDALLPGVHIVHYVIARGQQADEFHVGAGVDHRLGDGGLVGKDHLRVPDTGDDLPLVGEGSAVIDRQVAQLAQLVPAQVAGVLGVSVQNYDFHGGSSFMSFILPLSRQGPMVCLHCKHSIFGLSLKK